MSDARRLVTCLGEGLMDLLPMSEAGATVGFRLAPGGSILNVAVGLARLGVPAAFAGKLADDFFGRRLRDYLRAEGVRLDLLAAAPRGHTTLAFVIPPDATPTAGAADEPAFTFYGDNAADTLLTPEELPPALFAETAALHLGSISLLRGTTPLAARAAAERLKGQALLSLDPNIRPGLIADAPAYRATLGAFMALTDVLKLSLADVAWLEPDLVGADPLAVAASFAARGPQLVALTLGERGAALATRDGARASVAAPAVTLVDTVGAGDAFAAGLLGALMERGATTRAKLRALNQAELTEALRWAATVAALTCARPGANPPSRVEALAQMETPPQPHI
jgi:fructokinase